MRTGCTHQTPRTQWRPSHLPVSMRMRTATRYVDFSFRRDNLLTLPRSPRASCEIAAGALIFGLSGIIFQTLTRSYSSSNRETRNLSKASRSYHRSYAVRSGAILIPLIPMVASSVSTLFTHSQVHMAAHIILSVEIKTHYLSRYISMLRVDMRLGETFALSLGGHLLDSANLSSHYFSVPPKTHFALIAVSSSIVGKIFKVLYLIICRNYEDLRNFEPSKLTCRI